MRFFFSSVLGNKLGWKWIDGKGWMIIESTHTYLTPPYTNWWISVVVFNILAEFHEGRKNLSLSIKFYEPSILLSSLYSGTNNMGRITLFNRILRGGIYVMTRLIKDRLCLKITFMHNDCWVNYFEKCSRHWQICLSINQTHLIFFNTRFYLIFF